MSDQTLEVHFGHLPLLACEEVNNELYHIMSQTENNATFPSLGFDLFRMGGTQDDSNWVSKKLILNSGLGFLKVY